MEERTLNLAQCKEYMKNIVELEMSCYEQERMIKELKIRSANTERQKTDVDKKANETLLKKDSLILTLLKGVFGGLFGGATIAIVGAAIIWVLHFLYHVITFQWRKSPLDIPWGSCLQWGALIGLVIGVLAALIYYGTDLFGGRYGKYLEEYNKRVSQEKDNSALLNSQIQAINYEVSRTEESLSKTKSLLNSCYSLGYIYPKYRSLVPLATMYEYLDSGRCVSLIGPDGAYNIYESELRMNMILGKLDDVLTKLDDISLGQQLLADEIRKSNQEVTSVLNSFSNQLNSQLDAIEGNTALSAFYSKISAQNSTIDLWYKALKG